MELGMLLSHCDHTLLDPAAGWEAVRAICDDGIRYHTAAVCIPPEYVKQAATYCGKQVPICTVIGFPNGYHTTAVKVFETEQAVKDGADELDMVIQIGYLKERRYDELLHEIRAVKAACQGRLLKVIVEACLLTREEKEIVCRIVAQSGADYIKTSTGFSTGGATREDVALFARYLPKTVKIKAAGGIRTLRDAEAFLDLGADRLGTSRIVKLAKEQMQRKGTEDHDVSYSS